MRFTVGEFGKFNSNEDVIVYTTGVDFLGKIVGLSTRSLTLEDREDEQLFNIALGHIITIRKNISSSEDEVLNSEKLIEDVDWYKPEDEESYDLNSDI